jgi:hypothetical protein
MNFAINPRQADLTQYGMVNAMSSPLGGSE